MSADDIETIIGRVALKDRRAFAMLYDRTSAKLFGICLRILGDRAAAEDALQEAYVKIWQRADRFSAGRASAMAWLCAIARNQAIDVVRSRRAGVGTVELEAANALSDPAAGPERLAVAADDGRRIELCLAELDGERASAVRGAYVEGLSYQELATRHGVPLNTMRTWLRRSLIKLRECLER